MEVKNAVFYDSAKAQLDLVKQKVEALRAEVASLGGDTSEADQALQTIDTKLQLVETDVTNGVTANFTLRAEWQAKRPEFDSITQKIKDLTKAGDSDAGKLQADLAMVETAKSTQDWQKCHDLFDKLRDKVKDVAGEDDDETPKPAKAVKVVPGKLKGKIKDILGIKKKPSDKGESEETEADDTANEDAFIEMEMERISDFTSLEMAVERARDRGYEELPKLEDIMTKLCDLRVAYDMKYFKLLDAALLLVAKINKTHGNDDGSDAMDQRVWEGRAKDYEKFKNAIVKLEDGHELVEEFFAIADSIDLAVAEGRYVEAVELLDSGLLLQEVAMGCKRDTPEPSGETPTAEDDSDSTDSTDDAEENENEEETAEDTASEEEDDADKKAWDARARDWLELGDILNDLIRSADQMADEVMSAYNFIADAIANKNFEAALVRLDLVLEQARAAGERAAENVKKADKEKAEEDKAAWEKRADDWEELQEICATLEEANHPMAKSIADAVTAIEKAVKKEEWGKAVTRLDMALPHARVALEACEAQEEEDERSQPADDCDPEITPVGPGGEEPERPSITPVGPGGEEPDRPSGSQPDDDCPPEVTPDGPGGEEPERPPVCEDDDDIPPGGVEDNDDDIPPGGVEDNDDEDCEIREPETPEPTLRRGDQDPDGWVEYLQSLLQGYLGAGAVKITGKFDAKTEAAVKQFQSQNGCLVDGIVGNQTWSVLRGDAQRAEIGTDGREPGTYSEQGAEARWGYEDFAGEYDEGKDTLTMIVVSVGTEPIEGFKAEISVNGKKVVKTLGKPNETSRSGLGHHIILDKFCATHGDGPYTFEAYLPKELGGDKLSVTATLEELKGETPGGGEKPGQKPGGGGGGNRPGVPTPPIGPGGAVSSTLGVLVLDADGAPVSGACVSLTGPTSDEKNTDGRGYAVFEEIIPGGYTFTATADGATWPTGMCQLDPETSREVSLQACAAGETEDDDEGIVDEAMDWLAKQVSIVEAWFRQKIKEAEEELDDLGPLHDKLQEVRDYLNRLMDRGMDWSREKIDEIDSWIDEQKAQTESWYEQQKRNAAEWIDEKAEEAEDWYDEKREEAEDAYERGKDWLEEKRDQAGDAYERGKDWLEEKGDEAEEAYERGKDWLEEKGDQAEEAYERGKDWVEEKGEQAEDAYERGKDWVEEKGDQVEEFIDDILPSWAKRD